MKSDSMMNGVFSDNFGYDHIYGMCIVTKEFAVLKVHPSDAAAHGAGEDEKMTIETPICYCLISRQPFFQMHQDVLHSLLSTLSFLCSRLCREP